MNNHPVYILVTDLDIYLICKLFVFDFENAFYNFI